MAPDAVERVAYYSEGNFELHCDMLYSVRGALVWSHRGRSVMGRRSPDEFRWDTWHPQPDMNLTGYHLSPLGFGTSLTPSDIRSGAWFYVAAPHWLLAALFALAPAAFLVGKVRVIRRVNRGRCPSCGYDLRASPCRCPECGTLAEQPSS